MKITVVMGFFLPIPPVAGGAIEKTWHRLSQELVQRGHEVTVISRQWPDWPAEETLNRVRHLRLPGFDHKPKLWRNLICDLIWSWRVFRHLPSADVVALNTISLACWLGRFRQYAGKVVVMPGRMPKGQFHLYQRPALILVPSTPVKNAVLRERPTFDKLIRTIGYPIDWRSISAQSQKQADVVTIGYVGRIHQEKGIDLLAAALKRLAKMELPAWRAIVCGPADIARGGSGPDYLAELRRAAPSQVEFRDPVFHEPSLHELYQQFDIFCYPSLAAHGETFGVSVAEAMAGGAAPIVSDLECFLDFVKPGETGLTFNALAADAVDHLVDHLVTLITEPAVRATMGQAAQQTVKAYDFARYADDRLAEFAQLTNATKTASSPP